MLEPTRPARRTLSHCSLPGLILALSIGLSSGAVAGPTPNKPGAAGGGSGSGGSSPTSGASVPTIPVPAAFRSFYIVADGPDANFQTYATELTAKYMGMTFSGLQAAQPGPKGYVYFVSAPGWTQDTLSAACSKDGNVVGGLVIKFASFYTDGYWILFNAETQHVTPSLEYISCWHGMPFMAAPTMNIHTQKSVGQITIPVGPISGLATLFGPSSTAAWQVGVGTFALATTLGTFNGNVGLYNPGHEALGVANQISLQTIAVTRALCGIDEAVPATLVSRNETLAAIVERAKNSLGTDAATDAQITPTLASIGQFRSNENAAFPHLDQSLWPTPGPSGGPPQASAQSMMTVYLTRTKPAPTASPTPSPTASPSPPYPLEQLCNSIAPTPAPTLRSDVSPTP
jgi:hypothetical protein